MIRAVLFDLDDTLYDERHYYASAFAVIARELAARGAGAREELQSYLLALHGESRDRVFDRAAAQRNFPAAWVPELVALCRAHQPSLVLPEPTRRVLAALPRQYRVGCVTDGWAGVQRAKLASLGLRPLLDAVVIADDLGRAYWKPHPRPLLICCAMLQVRPQEAVFVGDHPERDVRGARRAGLRCIRLRAPGRYFAAYESPWTADAEIHEIAEVAGALAALEAGRLCA